MVMRLRQNMAELTDAELQLLYDLVVNVDTKYSISDEEQELLLLTGQKIVQMQESAIRAVLEEAIGN